MLCSLLLTFDTVPLTHIRKLQLTFFYVFFFSNFLHHLLIGPPWWKAQALSNSSWRLHGRRLQKLGHVGLTWRRLRTWDRSWKNISSLITDTLSTGQYLLNSLMGLEQIHYILTTIPFDCLVAYSMYHLDICNLRVNKAEIYFIFEITIGLSTCYIDRHITPSILVHSWDIYPNYSNGLFCCYYYSICSHFYRKFICSIKRNLQHW